MQTARGGLSTGVVSSTIYALGSEGDPNTISKIFPQVQSYDIENDAWTRLPHMLVPRHATFAATIDGGICIPRGRIIINNNSTAYFDAFRP